MSGIPFEPMQRSTEPADTVTLFVHFHGDPEAGLPQRRVEVVLPFTEAFVREEAEWARDVKMSFMHVASAAVDERVAYAAYDFELDEMADVAERASEQEKGQ